MTVSPLTLCWLSGMTVSPLTFCCLFGVTITGRQDIFLLQVGGGAVMICERVQGYDLAQSKLNDEDGLAELELLTVQLSKVTFL